MAPPLCWPALADTREAQHRCNGIVAVALMQGCCSDITPILWHSIGAILPLMEHQGSSLPPAEQLRSGARKILLAKRRSGAEGSQVAVEPAATISQTPIPDCTWQPRQNYISNRAGMVLMSPVWDQVAAKKLGYFTSYLFQQVWSLDQWIGCSHQHKAVL